MRSSVDSEVRTGLRGGGYLLELECLRGLAVLLVFLFHAWGIATGGGAGDRGPVAALLSVGNTGVTLFFVLSGFLLSRPWLRALAEPGRPRPRLAAYALARAARILPMYYAMIAVAAIDLGDAGVVVPAATFQMLGFAYFPYSVVWWTLVTEMQFYLLLPVVGVLALQGRAGRTLLLALAAAWLAWYVTQVLLAPEALRGFVVTKSVFARLPAFLFGAAAAFIGNTARGRELLDARLRAVVAAVAAAALLGLLLRVARVGESTAEAVWPSWHIGEGLFWSLILLALAGGPRALWRRPLVNAPMAVLGKLSYSVYLLHVPLLFYLVYPVQAAAGGNAELLLRILLAGVLTLALSALTYAFIERPFLRLKARLHR